MCKYIFSAQCDGKKMGGGRGQNPFLTVLHEPFFLHYTTIFCCLTITLEIVSVEIELCNEVEEGTPFK